MTELITGSEVSTLDANDYQKQAARTAGDFNLDSVLTMCALGLTGESGEFADMVKKHLYHDHELDREKLIKELGDVLWYLARACTALEVDLSTVMQTNLDKLWKRYPQGFQGKPVKPELI